MSFFGGRGFGRHGHVLCTRLHIHTHAYHWHHTHTRTRTHASARARTHTHTHTFHATSLGKSWTCQRTDILHVLNQAYFQSGDDVPVVIPSTA